MLNLRINGNPIPQGSLLQIRTGDGVKHDTNANGASLYCTDTRSYVDWYSEFIHSKQLAMLKGGSAAVYTFTKPFGAHNVRSINSINPDSVGNITILGSQAVDVCGSEETEATVVVTRPVSKRTRISQLEEIYLFTMRLYSAINHIVSRLLEFSPDTWDANNLNDKLGKLRGSLLNYQANVARWNFLVWKSSYTQVVEASRQNMAISLGYSCTSCKIKAAKITTVITPVDVQPTEIDGVDSTYCLTVYRQSTADERNKKDEKVITSIKKYITGSAGEPLELFGFGMDASYDNWEKIEIIQELPEMEQTDRYSELFSLAPGMGVSEYIYLSKEDDPNKATNKFNVKTTWEIQTESGDTVTMDKSTDIEVAAVNAKKINEEEG